MAGDRDEDEELRRLASGWGRKPARQERTGQPRRWDEPLDAAGSPGGDEAADRDAPRPAPDLEEGADAGAISGRAATRAPQALADGDTLGGAAPADQGASDVPVTPSEPDANRAQADPRSGNPPRR